jgi:thymidine kinase
MYILISGPMFSGKTTHLISYAQRFRTAHKKMLFVKHSIDTRYSSDPEVISHDGLVFKSDDQSSCRIITTTTLNDISDEFVQNVDCILIDEGQFFDDLGVFIKKFVNTKTIVVSSLISDFRMQPFTNTVSTISFADTIYHMSANCAVCEAETSFTARVVNNDSQILVGSTDAYEPRCRQHHPFSI